MGVVMKIKLNTYFNTNNLNAWSNVILLGILNVEYIYLRKENIDHKRDVTSFL